MMWRWWICFRIIKKYIQKTIKYNYKTDIEVNEEGYEDIIKYGIDFIEKIVL